VLTGYGATDAMWAVTHRAGPRAAVMLEAERRGWPPPPGAALYYVTAGLEVRYLRPSPLHEASELRAAATAHWKRWRPRWATRCCHPVPGGTCHGGILSA